MNLPELVQMIRFTADGLEKTQGQVQGGLKSIGSAVDGFNRTVTRRITGGVTAAFRGLSSTIGTVASDITSFGSGIGIAAAGAVASLGASGFQMASQLELANIQFETMFKSADRAKEHVNELFQFAKKTPFESGPVIEASRQLETMGGAALNTKEMLTLVGDAAAGSSKSIEEISFWTGRAYSAIQAGRPFGEAAMRMQELGLLSGDTRTKMEELQKSGAKGTEVWDLFTKELGRFSGSMEKQAKTLQGVKSTFDDIVKLTAADVFKPALESYKEFFGAFNEFAETPAFATISLNLKKIVEDVLGFADAGARFKTLLDGITSTNVQAFFDTMGSAIGKVVDLFDGAAPIIGAFFSVFASGFLRSMPFVGKFMPMISPITGIFIALVTSSERFRDALLGLGLAFKDIDIEPVVDAFGGLARVLGNVLGSVIEDITPLLGELFETIARITPGVLKSIGTALGGVADGFSALLSAGLETVITLLDTLAPIVDDLAGPVGDLASALGNTLGGVLEDVTPLLVDLFEAFGDIAPSLLDSIASLLEDVGDALSTILSSGLKAVTELIKILGPILEDVAPLVGDLAEAFGDFIAVGINSLIAPLSGIATAIGGLVQAVLPELVTLLGRVSPLFDTLFTALGGGIAGLIDAVAANFDKVATAVGDILEAGLPVIAGIIEALGNALIPVVPLLGDAATAIGNVVSAGLEKIGPPIEQIVTAAGKLVTAILPYIITGFETLGPLVSGLAGAGLGVIADIFGVLASHADLLAPALTAVGIAWATIKIGQEVTTGLSVFRDVMGGIDVGKVDGVGASIGNLAGSFQKNGGLAGAASSAGSAIAGSVGPMLAVTAVTAVATYGIMKYINEKREQKALIEGATQALQKESGTLDNNTKAWVRAQVVAENQDDDLQKLKIGYEGYNAVVNGSTTASRAFATALQAQGDGSVQVMTKSEGLRAATVEETMAFLEGSDAVKENTDIMYAQADANAGLIEDTRNRKDAMREAAEATLNDMQNTGKLTDAQRDYYVAQLDSLGATEDFTDILEDASDASATTSEEQRDAAEAFDESADAVNRTRDAYDDAASAASTYNDVLDRLFGRNVDAQTSTLKLEQSLGDLQASWQDNEASTDESRVATAKFRDEMTETTGALDDTGKAIVGMSTEGKLSFTQLAEEAQRVTEANIKSGMSADEAALKAKDYAGQLVEQFVQMGANRSEVEAFAASVGILPEQIDMLVQAVGIEQETTKLRDYVSAMEGIDPTKQTDIIAMLDAGQLDAAYTALSELTGMPREAIVAAVATGVAETDAQIAEVTGPTDVPAEVPVVATDIPEAASMISGLTGPQGTAEIGVEVDEPVTKARGTIKSIENDDYKANVRVDADKGAEGARDTIRSIENDDYEATMDVDADKGADSAQNTIEDVENKDYEASMDVDPQPGARNADRTISGVADERRTATIDVVAPKIPSVDRAIDAIIKDRTAEITVTAPAAATVDSRIDSIASQSRTATIDVQTSNLENVKRALDLLDNPATKTITVVTNQKEGLASGGPAFAGRLYMVGENGPELFAPSQDGHVFPSHHPMSRLAAKMGTLQFVEPAPARALAGAGVVGGGGTVASNNRNLSINSMVINQDLDMEIAMTRIGMAMAGRTL